MSRYNNGKIRFIYWFAYYNLDSPSVRYRAKYPLDFAKKELGIENQLVFPGYSLWRISDFIKAYTSALLFPKSKSIIVIQRVQSNFIYSNLLKILVLLRKSKTVYDLDDADYLIANSNTIHFFAKNCKYVSSGSKEIENHMRLFNQNVIHLTSPTPDLGIQKQKRNEIFTIGWLGGFGGSHKDGLYEYIFPAIKNLSFNCKLLLIGVSNSTDEKEIREYFEKSNHVQLEIPRKIDWNNELELQNRIKRFDIGVATLLNQPMQLGKSGIKAKQYMNNGIPVLSNNLPENNNVVIDGFNGFLCDSSEEFKQRIIQFKEMTSEEYSVFSKNARQSVNSFDHNKYFEDFNKMKITPS